MMRTKNLNDERKTKNLSKNSQPPVYCALHLYIPVYKFVCIALLHQTNRLCNPTCVFIIFDCHRRRIRIEIRHRVFVLLHFTNTYQSFWHFHLTVEIIQKREPYIFDGIKPFQIFLNNFFCQDFFFFFLFITIRKLKHEDSNWSYTPQLSKMKKKPSVRTLFGVNRFFKIFYILIFECLSLSSGREGLTNRSSTSGLLILYPLSLFFF